ncbi:MAG: DUF4384 domain-containing protein [Desulfobacterales bacterium]|jgi:hypothetical protein|nr:DUF4384 domain-containing protein [Desulfobacterales bacterium]
MKTLRVVRIALPTIFCLFLLFESHAVIHAQETAAQQEANVKFQWAFGALKKANGSKFEAVSKDTDLKTGDQIKFFLKVNKNCFVYLIYRSSQGELSVLFPYRFKLQSAEYTIAGNHYIPKGDQWFELDEHTGEERFYLLASVERLIDLEARINDYESADNSKKPPLAKKILSEVRNLRKQHLKFKTYAERPVNIIGNLRGTEKAETAGPHDIAKFAVEISADTFYSRTFTIDHK